MAGGASRILLCHAAVLVSSESVYVDMLEPLNSAMIELINAHATQRCFPNPILVTVAMLRIRRNFWRPLLTLVFRQWRSQAIMTTVNEMGGTIIHMYQSTPIYCTDIEKDLIAWPMSSMCHPSVDHLRWSAEAIMGVRAVQRYLISMLCCPSESVSISWCESCDKKMV